MKRAFCQVAADRQPLMRELGLDVHAVFTHPGIKVWRELPDRQNALLDATLVDGREIRLHVKRYPRVAGRTTPAQIEAEGIRHLVDAGIATVPLIAWGRDEAGRSFIITEDLAGSRPLDKLIAEGLEFSRIMDSTARIAAKLHDRGLHHRDLYLCHFFAPVDHPDATPALIDAARVRPLPRFFRERWIVKDLAQFRYSARQLDVPGAELDEWLKQYAAARKLTNVGSLGRRIGRKTDSIARHDRRLSRRQPRRHVSIP